MKSQKTWILAFLYCFLAAIMPAQAESGWNLAQLDTARQAAYLNNLEKEVILELNKVRSNPPQYAEDYVKPLRQLYQGNYLVYPGEIRIITNEGLKAVEECLHALKGAAAVPVLTPSYGLSRATQILVRDQAVTGQTGHDTSDGQSMTERMNTFGQWQGTAGENVDYGNHLARRVVLSLLVDDGVPSRGHRTNILNPAFKVVGVASGSHKAYRHMFAMDFAGGYKEKDKPPTGDTQSVPAPSLAPVEVPVRFLKAVVAHDYALAWTLWTEKTKQVVIQFLLEKVPNLKMSPAEVRQLFVTNDPLVHDFWQDFRDNIQPDKLLQETYTLLQMVSENHAIIKSTPSGAEILVFKEDGIWKLGYAETFMQ